MCNHCSDPAHISFDDLEGDLDSEPTGKVDHREKFPCTRCGGTGTYHWGYVNRGSGKCHACNGRGYFLTDQKTRFKAKARRQINVDRARESIREQADAFLAQNPAIKSWLDWNCNKQEPFEFAVSLRDALYRYGSWTPKQQDAVLRMVAKAAERRAEREANKPTVDLSKIVELFDTALERGLNKRALIFGMGPVVETYTPSIGEPYETEHEATVKLTPAGPQSRNPAGTIYVSVDGEYAGKIYQGKFSQRRPVKGLVELLQRVAQNPEEEARLYGQRTGVCCCCGRELTDPVSIDAGIGPICASRWF